MSSEIADPQRPAARHLGAGAALSVVSDVGSLGAAAAVSVVLARVIGPSANGTYALLGTLINITVLVVSLGAGAGITYQVSHRRWPVSRAFAAVMRASLALGVIGAVGSLGLYALTRHSAFRAIAPHLAIIGILAITPAVAWQFITAILLGRDRYESYAGVQLINACLLFLSCGLAVAFGLTGAVAGFTAAMFLTALGGMWLMRRWIRQGRSDPTPVRDLESGPSHLKGAFTFGLQSWVGNITQQANYRLDLLILGAFAGASHIGVYSVAVTVTEIAWILPHGLQTVLLPRTADLDAAAAHGDVTAAESDAAVARALRHSVLLVVPAGLIVVTLLALVPVIYGGKFGESFDLGLVLLPGVLVLGVGKVLGSVVAGRGRPRYMLYSSLIGAAVTMALYATMIPRYHEWGASIASTISYVLTAFIVLIFFRRLTRIPLTTALIPTRADVGNYLEALRTLLLHLRSRRPEHPVA